MAATSRGEMRRIEDEAYNDGWKDARKKYGKKNGTKVVLWTITSLFVVTHSLCFVAWAIAGSYPEQLIDVAFKALSLVGGGCIVKSGAENYGKITHAAEYNQNYPDA